MNTEIVLSTQKVTLEILRIDLLKSKLSEISIGKSTGFRILCLNSSSEAYHLDVFYGTNI